MQPRGALEGRECTLSDLEDCTLFLLAPLAALFMHRLRRCRVVTGPVAGATFMEGRLGGRPGCLALTVAGICAVGGPCHPYPPYTQPLPNGPTLLRADLQDCRLFVASRQVRVHSTQGSDLYLRVKSNPVIEHSSGVRVAPYAPTYPGAEQDLAAQGLEAESGLWGAVQDFGWLRAAASPHWCVLPDLERQPPPQPPTEEEGAGAGL